MTIESRCRWLTLATVSAIAWMAGTARADLRVVTTTTDLADIASAIGGEHASVESICAGEQDPHYVQARPSYMVKLSRADLLVHVGLDLEIAWLPSLVRGARNPSINPGKPGNLDASTAVTPLDVPGGPIDRSQGDIHPRGNPHYWLDPDNGKKIAAAIAQRMAGLAPKHAAYFGTRLARWTASVDAAIARWTTRMASLRGAEVVSYHATFNYFHDRFGLEPVGYVEEKPGIPPAPAHLARLITKMKRDQIGVIFHENYYDDATSKLSREHAVSTADTGLISVAGGKYTTYRIMAKDAAQCRGERNAVFGVNRDLVHTGDVILNRVFHRNDVLLDGVDGL